MDAKAGEPPALRPNGITTQGTQDKTLNRMNTVTRSCLFVAIAITTCASGCKAPFFESAKMPWNRGELAQSNYETPARLAVIWTPDVVITPGRPAARGFGGRIYFYDRHNKPIPVDGQLAIYAYDDSAEGANREAPDRKYAFTPDQFRARFSESQIGASYSVWLPWGPATDQDQKSVSLLPVFTSTSGQIVMGQQAINLLRGREENDAPRGPQHPSLAASAANGVRRANLNEGIALNTAATQVSGSEEIDERQRLETTTISLPRSMKQRLIENGAATPTAAQIPDQLREQLRRASVPPLSTSSFPTPPAVESTPSQSPESSRFLHRSRLAPRVPTEQSGRVLVRSQPRLEEQPFGRPSQP